MVIKSSAVESLETIVLSAIGIVVGWDYWNVAT